MEFGIISSYNGLILATLSLEPQNRPFKGVVQIVHGMCEHKERYIPFMKFLAQNGYVAVIHDNRGHGASIEGQNDLGYFNKDGAKALLQDTHNVNEWIRTNYPGLKVTLFGHSMGSMIVRNFAKRYDDTIDSLFVCGSPSDNPAKGAGRIIAALTGFFRGWHHRSSLLQRMSFDAYNKPFEDEGYASAWVCSDKSVLEQYHNDPLCQFVFTANGFYHLMRIMQDCYSRKGWKVKNPSLPVHFISGALDPCRIDDKSFDKAVNLMQNAGYSNVDAKLYPGMRHEILNETDHSVVWDDILAKLPHND